MQTSTARTSRIDAIPDAVVCAILSWLDFPDHCRFASCAHRIDLVARRHPAASSPTMTIRVGATYARHPGTSRLRAKPRTLVVHTSVRTRLISCTTLAASLPLLRALCVVGEPSVTVDCDTLVGFRRLETLDVRAVHLENDDTLAALPRLRELLVRGRDRVRLCGPALGRTDLVSRLVRFDSLLGPAPIESGLLECRALTSVGYSASVDYNTGVEDDDDVAQARLRIVLEHLPALEHLTVRALEFLAGDTTAYALTHSQRSAHLRSLALVDCVVSAKMSGASLLQQIGAHLQALEQLEISYDTDRSPDSIPRGLVRSEDATALGALPHLSELSIATGPPREPHVTADVAHYGLGTFPVLERLVLSDDYPVTGLVAPRLRHFNGRVLDLGESPVHAPPVRAFRTAAHRLTALPAD